MKVKPGHILLLSFGVCGVVIFLMALLLRFLQPAPPLDKREIIYTSICTFGFETTVDAWSKEYSQRQIEAVAREGDKKKWSPIVCRERHAGLR
jgi:hypothetical protein